MLGYSIDVSSKFCLNNTPYLDATSHVLRGFDTSEVDEDFSHSLDFKEEAVFDFVDASFQTVSQW